MSDNDIKHLKRSVVLLHGVFPKDFFSLFKDRKEEPFFVTEGRPSLESAQSNCGNLNKLGITPTLISDNMAGFLFYKDLIKEVWLAYREADKRGAFCFIGASILGILAKDHQVPVFCCQAQRPKSARGTRTKTGAVSGLMGDPEELTHFKGARVAPKSTEAYVPLMEWVPGSCFEAKYGTQVVKGGV